MVSVVLCYILCVQFSDFGNVLIVVRVVVLRTGGGGREGSWRAMSPRLAEQAILSMIVGGVTLIGKLTGKC